MGCAAVIYRFDDCLLDTESLELRRGDEVVSVEPQVFSVLVYLIQHRERVVSKDELIEAVWEGRAISDGALNSRINAARRAVGDSGNAQTIIKTFPRRGFRFVGALSDDTSSDVTQEVVTSVTDKPSIAVLPFDNLSNDQEQEYFCDGITEDLITGLSRIRQFFVIARNTSFTFKGQPVDVQAVARQLGVRYVLEGSVRKAGIRVRISAQLIDGASGNQIWAERYDRDLEDIFEVQDEITNTVVGRIEPELSRAERERARQKPIENLDARGLYQRGMSSLFPFTTMDIAEAENHFLQAIELSRSFARAHVGLALCHFFRFSFRQTQPDVDHQDEGLEAAKQAVKLDRNDAAARAVLGLMKNIRGENEEAIRHLKKAIEMNPSYANGYYWLARTLVCAGKARESLEYSEAAIRLSPNDPMVGPTMVRRAEAYLSLKNYTKAEEWAEKSLNDLNTQFWGNAVLAAARALKGDKQGVEQAMAELLRRKPDFNIRMLTALGISDPAHLEVYAEGLRKAGAPE